MRNLGNVRYMMATTARHNLGDISRNVPSLCAIYAEDGEDWVGRFVTGFGFFDVRFPKKTTREPSKKEKQKLNGSVFGVGGQVRDFVVFPGFGVSKRALIVKTSNSTYRIGKAGKDGIRSILRDERPLHFTSGKLDFLKVGFSMLFVQLNGVQWETSRVVSIEFEKTPRMAQAA